MFFKKLNQLRTSDIADVELLCGRRTFPAHRVVLSASSPVFETMFQSSFREAREKSVRMSIGEKSMEKVLSFIYLQDEAQVAFKKSSEVVDLLNAAHYLEIDALVRFCCTKALHVITAADFSVIVPLKKDTKFACIDRLITQFVTKHCLQIFQDDLHLRYEHSLLVTLLEKLRDEMIVPADVAIDAIIRWCEHDQTRTSHVDDLLSLVDVSDMSKLVFERVLQNPIVNKNRAVLINFINAMIRHDERKLINALRVYEIKLVNLEIVFVCTSFSSNSLSQSFTCQYLSSECKDRVHCISHDNCLYVVAGGNKTVHDSTTVARFDPKLLKFDSMLQSEFIYPVSTIVLTAVDLIAIQKKGRYGSYSLDCTYFLHRTIAGTGNWNKAYSTDVQEDIVRKKWLATTRFLIQIGQKPNSTTLELCLFPIAAIKDDRLLAPAKEFFQGPVQFNRNMTFSLSDSIYTFHQEDVYVYNVEQKTVQRKPSGMFFGADDPVMYPVRDYSKELYVIVRRNHLPTEFVYNVWQFGSSKFADRKLIRPKGALTDAIGLLDFNSP